MSMLDPSGVLNNQSEDAEKEVSLKTLTKKQKEKILQSFIRCRGVAKNHYETVIEPKIKERLDIYNASQEHYDKVFPQLSELCRWTSKDVKTCCEWILPGLMETFTGTEEPLSIKGVKPEDDEAAKNLQELIRYQLQRKANFYNCCQALLRYSLSVNFAVAKVWWNRVEIKHPREFMLDTIDTDMLIALNGAVMSGKAEIESIKPLPDAPDFLHVKYNEIEVKENHPIVEYVPHSEFRYTPDEKDIHECKFVAQRKIVHGDYLKRRERDGVFENVDKAIADFGTGDTSTNVLSQKEDYERSDRANRPDDDDKASKELELYEAYLKVDYNDDGIYENLIIHAVGDHLLRVAKNDYEFPPFFICCAEYDPNAVFNKDSFADVFEQNQDLKTALIRQIIINTAKNNAPRYFVNEQRVDMDAFISGEEIIPTTGNPSELVFVPPSLPIAGLTMQMVEYAQNELEAQSGSTRYNQGLDSNSLNSTATGITAIMGASEKRNKQMARAIAENMFIPMFKFLIMLNQMHLEDEQMVRLTNKSVSIRKEDLDIDYDLIVNVGEGAGTKEAQIQYLMLVINSIYPILQAQGIVNERSWYNLVCKLLEQLGLRDVSQFLMDPDSPEAQQAREQKQQEAMAAQAEQLKNSLALTAAKVSMPRVDIDFETLPPDVQREYLIQKLGIETTEKAIAEHEVFTKQ